MTDKKPKEPVHSQDFVRSVSEKVYRAELARASSVGAARPRRKAIPLKVKVEVNLSQNGRCAACKLHMNEGVEYDHRPPIILRPVNARGTDYEPRQLDPEYIEALHPECHQMRTTGRKPGALRTITTKGSDVGLKTKFARLEGKTKRRPKQKIPSRPFQQGRKFDVRR